MPIAATLLATTLRSLLDFDASIGDAVEVEMADMEYAQATWDETVIRGRPWVPFRRLATLSKGTRLRVRGRVKSRDNEGCRGRDWIAVWPFGYVCSLHLRASKKGPKLEPALAPLPKARVPHRYIFVREDGIPLFESRDVISQGGPPLRELSKGMSLVATRSVSHEGKKYVETAKGNLIPREGVRWGGGGSSWTGVQVLGRFIGPSFAWVFPKKLDLREGPSLGSKSIAQAKRRQRLTIIETRSLAPHQKQSRNKNEGWLKVRSNFDGQWLTGWVPASKVNEVVFRQPPFELHQPGNSRWIDVDLGEQVMVAYRGFDPVFATLISSGRGHPTPRGNYDVWAKVASTTMANQAYEDDPYMVQGVPWVMFFQAHNAFHGAYWHDRFGTRKSHGCINLSPADAHWLFEWSSFPMLEGWTGYLPPQPDLQIHIHDSNRPEGDRFTQERRPGPPDREEEKRKLEEAEARRAALEAEKAEADSEPSDALLLHEQAPSFGAEQAELVSPDLGRTASPSDKPKRKE